MSLTSFLERKDVRERFRQEFDMPRMKTKRELLAPPLSNRYSLVGTAFDYLARFYVKRLNPDAITKAWIAERAIRKPDLWYHDGDHAILMRSNLVCHDVHFDPIQRIMRPI